MFWALAAFAGAISITHLSFGRTGVFVLAAGLLGWILRSFKGKRLTLWLVTLAAVTGIATVTSSAMMTRLQQAVVEAKQSEENNKSSIGHRLYNYQVTPRMIAAAPLLGHGTGSYHSELCKFLDNPDDCSIYGWHPHNQFLMLGAEHGLLGIGLYVLMIIMLFHAARRSPDPGASALMCALTGILIADSVVNTPFFSSRESQFFSYMIALMLSMNLPRTVKEAQ
jgi:O-antigen ligase